VDNAVFVEIAEAYCDLGANELDDVFLEAAVGVEMVVEVAPSDVVEEEVKAEFVLEDIVHAQNEGVVGLEEDVFLVFSVLDLVLVDQHVLVYSLHRVHLLGLGANDEEYLAKGPLINHFFNLEILETGLL